MSSVAGYKQWVGGVYGLDQPRLSPLERPRLEPRPTPLIPNEGLCRYDRVVIGPLFHASQRTPSSPASTTPPTLYISFASLLGTPGLSFPTFWTTFPPLVGFQSGNVSVSAPAAKSFSPLFMQAICLGSEDAELTC